MIVPVLPNQTSLTSGRCGLDLEFVMTHAIARTLALPTALLSISFLLTFTVWF
jgi:hypothetical protein